MTKETSRPGLKLLSQRKQILVRIRVRKKVLKGTFEKSNVLSVWGMVL